MPEIMTQDGVASFESVTAALEGERVLRVSRRDDGTFRIKELCDEYFFIDVTRDQLVEWANELKRLAESDSL